MRPISTDLLLKAPYKHNSILLQVFAQHQELHIDRKNKSRSRLIRKRTGALYAKEMKKYRLPTEQGTIAEVLKENG